MKNVHVEHLDWRSIEEKTPRTSLYVLARGPSGYSGTPYRYLVCKRDPEFRPRQPWVDHAGDSVLDGGEMITEWVYL